MTGATSDPEAWPLILEDGSFRAVSTPVDITFGSTFHRSELRDYILRHLWGTQRTTKVPSYPKVPVEATIGRQLALLFIGWRKLA
jgi:hypothetical protein